MSDFFANYGLMLLWFSVAVLTLVVESITADMVSIWFLPSAIVTLILAIWVEQFWIQLLVFLALSVISLFLSYRFFKKHPAKQQAEELNAEGIIGKQGIITEEVDNLHESGAVKVGGLTWTARSADDVVIKPNTVVIVTGISGVKVYCRISE